MKINALKEIDNPIDANSICVPLERQLDWSEQLINALKYLNSLDKPVMHRDIKPEFVLSSFIFTFFSFLFEIISFRNLLLKNNHKTLKFADFGFGKKFDQADNQVLTNCGTLRYQVENFENFELNKCCRTFQILRIRIR